MQGTISLEIGQSTVALMYAIYVNILEGKTFMGSWTMSDECPFYVRNGMEWFGLKDFLFFFAISPHFPCSFKRIL